MTSSSNPPSPSTPNPPGPDPRNPPGPDPRNRPDPAPRNPPGPASRDLPAVAAAVDRLTGEVARLRDDLQPLRAVPLRLDHLERAVSADSSAGAAWAAGVERGLDDLATTVRGALAEMAAAVDGSLTALADSLRNRRLVSPRGAESGASAVSAASVATVLEAAERIVGREIGELRDDLADALEEVLGQVSAQLTTTSAELRSTLADLAGRADPADPAGPAGPAGPPDPAARPADPAGPTHPRSVASPASPRSVADPVIPRPAAGLAAAVEEYAVQPPRPGPPKDEAASAGDRVPGESFAGAGAEARVAQGSGRELRRAGTDATGDGGQAARPSVPWPAVSSPVSAPQGSGSEDASTERRLGRTEERSRWTEERS